HARRLKVPEKLTCMTGGGSPSFTPKEARPRAGRPLDCFQVFQARRTRGQRPERLILLILFKINQTAGPFFSVRVLPAGSFFQGCSFVRPAPFSGVGEWGRSGGGQRRGPQQWAPICRLCGTCATG